MSGNAGGSSRIKLWLIVALCVAPVAASYIVYYFAPPQGQTNYGDLVVAPLSAPTLLRDLNGAAVDGDALKGKWLLLMVDSGRCDDFCQRKLFNLRQLRLSQGKDQQRIERVWLISDEATPPAAVTNEYEGTRFLRAAGSSWLKELPFQNALADHIYIIDPLGNVVMRYPRSADPLKVIKDLERLLDASNIG